MAERIAQIIKVCLNCGEDFVQQHLQGRTIYCGRECREAYAASKRTSHKDQLIQAQKHAIELRLMLESKQ